MKSSTTEGMNSNPHKGRGGARIISEDGLRRRSAARKAKWEEWRAVREMEEKFKARILQAERRRKMLETLTDKYEPQRIYKMSDKEAMAFSQRMAVSATETVRIRRNGVTAGHNTVSVKGGCAVVHTPESKDYRKMTCEETAQYAKAIYDAIIYFNSRSRQHADHMRYLEECKKRREELDAIRLADSTRRKVDVVIR